MASEKLKQSDNNLSEVGQVLSDPFSPENLRLEQAFSEQVAVKKLLLTIPVRRPPSQDWFRSHPDPNYRQNIAVINLKEENEFYVVTRDLVQELFSECVSVTVHLCINRQGTVFFWPIRLPDALGKDMSWWQSARMAAERATNRWVRIQADRNLAAYHIYEAADDLGEPEWPTEPFWELIKIAFKNNLIDSIDHPVVRRLRGFAA